MPTLPLMNAASLQPGIDVYHRYDVKRPVRREDCLSLHAKDRSFILCETELLFCQEAVKKLSEMYSANGETMNTASLARMQERLNHLWGPRQRLPGNAIYLLPSDRCEWERLHFEHYALKVAFGRSFFAPLLQPRSILDVGCGPGFWAMEMCRTFPQAQVVGIDIAAPSPLNPPDN